MNRLRFVLNVYSVHPVGTLKEENKEKTEFSGVMAEVGTVPDDEAKSVTKVQSF